MIANFITFVDLGMTTRGKCAENEVLSWKYFYCLGTRALLHNQEISPLRMRQTEFSLSWEDRYWNRSDFLEPHLLPGVHNSVPYSGNCTSAHAPDWALALLAREVLKSQCFPGTIFTARRPLHSSIIRKLHLCECARMSSRSLGKINAEIAVLSWKHFYCQGTTALFHIQETAPLLMRQTELSFTWQVWCWNSSAFLEKFLLPGDHNSVP
jgi:hypothetical protein